MRIALTIPLLLLNACSASSTEPSPLVVLYEADPWSRGTVASLSPVFALYDDGLAIYLERQGDRVPRYATVTLSENDRAQLLASLPPGLDDLEEYYSLFDMPHQPSNVLHFWRNGRRKTVCVYGSIRHDPELRKNCPRPFLTTYDAVRKFKHHRAVAWRPEKVALRFSEQKLTRPPRRPWPTGWPDLSHPDTRQVSNGYVLHLDFEHLTELAALWEHPRNSHADVEISGRQGHVTYWVPFPCHEAWEDWGRDADGR